MRYSAHLMYDQILISVCIIASQITWCDVQHIFREMLKQLKGPDDAILLNWEDVPMLCRKVHLT